MAKKLKDGIPIIDSVQLQSVTIDLLRFPLAILVIFIHMSPTVANILEAEYGLLSGKGLLNALEISISYVIAQTAVPSFFFISGFLFFMHFKEWSWAGYRKKLLSRVKSLLVPYFLWNTTAFLLIVIAMLVVAIKGGSVDRVIEFVSEKNWHYLFDCNEWWGAELARGES